MGTSTPHKETPSLGEQMTFPVRVSRNLGGNFREIRSCSPSRRTCRPTVCPGSAPQKPCQGDGHLQPPRTSPTEGSLAQAGTLALNTPSNGELTTCGQWFSLRIRHRLGAPALGHRTQSPHGDPCTRIRSPGATPSPSRSDHRDAASTRVPLGSWAAAVDGGGPALGPSPPPPSCRAQEAANPVSIFKTRPGRQSWRPTVKIKTKREARPAWLSH